MTLLTYWQKRIENLPHPMPGESAHLKMVPPERGDVDLEFVKTMNPRLAAVLIMLYEEDGDIYFPLLKRQTYDGVHSAQYGLPGGSFDAEDLVFENAALRETHEELGVLQEDVEILCQLSEVYIPPSKFLVYPFVGIHHGKPIFIPDETEVEFWLPISLEAFLAAEPTEMEIQKGEESTMVPAYHLGEEEYLWGATAMILQELKDWILRHEENPHF